MLKVKLRETFLAAVMVGFVGGVGHSSATQEAGEAYAFLPETGDHQGWVDAVDYANKYFVVGDVGFRMDPLVQVLDSNGQSRTLDSVLKGKWVRFVTEHPYPGTSMSPSGRVTKIWVDGTRIRGVRP